LIVAAATAGTPGMRDLYQRIVRWRVAPRWYLFAVVGIPAIMVLGAIVLPGVPASFQLPAAAAVLAYPVSFAVSFWIGGPLGEEPGWRGFALPRLQALYGPLLGSFILAPLHVLWHLPLYWVPEWGTPRETSLDLAAYALSGVALTFIYTWLYNATKGSVLITTLAHTSVDAFFLNQLFLAPAAASLVPFVIGFGFVAILLIVFTRGQLGYERNQDPSGGPPNQGL
jgi:membrane protease YdiL (CAAX protease family)